MTASHHTLHSSEPRAAPLLLIKLPLAPFPSFGVSLCPSLYSSSFLFLSPSHVVVSLGIRALQVGRWEKNSSDFFSLLFLPSLSSVHHLLCARLLLLNSSALLLFCCYLQLSIADCCYRLKIHPHIHRPPSARPPLRPTNPPSPPTTLPPPESSIVVIVSYFLRQLALRSRVGLSP